MQILSETLIMPAQQHRFTHENVFEKASFRRLSIVGITKTAFTGSFAANPVWHQEIALRQIKTLGSGQPFADFHISDNFHIQVTTITAGIFQGHMSIAIDNFEDQNNLVVDLTPVQDATEHCRYPKLIGEPLRLQLGSKLANAFVTDLLGIRKRM